MSNIELKPCPFCGGEATIKRYFPPFSRRSRVTIKCSQCRANAGKWWRVNYATKAWNRRVTT